MIRLEVIEGPEYQRDEDGWENYAYTVRLRRDGRTLTTEWHQGMALTQTPRAEEVLASLLSDAAGIEYVTFEGWAEDYGFDTDSRKAERTFKAIEKQTRRLKRFLGEDFECVSAQAEDLEDAATRLVNA